MLKLKLQYFGHLMRRVDSLEKTLMLGGIGGRRKRTWNQPVLLPGAGCPRPARQPAATSGPGPARWTREAALPGGNPPRRGFGPQASAEAWGD